MFAVLPWNNLLNVGASVGDCFSAEDTIVQLYVVLSELLTIHVGGGQWLERERERFLLSKNEVSL